VEEGVNNQPTGKAWPDTVKFILGLAAAISAVFGALETVKDFVGGETAWWHAVLVVCIGIVFSWCIYLVCAKRNEPTNQR
jgi:hypothetical protein